MDRLDEQAPLVSDHAVPAAERDPPGDRHGDVLVPVGVERVCMEGSAVEFESHHLVDDDVDASGVARTHGDLHADVMPE